MQNCWIVAINHDDTIFRIDYHHPKTKYPYLHYSDVKSQWCSKIYNLLERELAYEVWPIDSLRKLTVLYLDIWLVKWSLFLCDIWEICVGKGCALIRVQVKLQLKWRVFGIVEIKAVIGSGSLTRWMVGSFVCSLALNRPAFGNLCGKSIRFQSPPVRKGQSHVDSLVLAIEESSQPTFLPSSFISLTTRICANISISLLLLRDTFINLHRTLIWHISHFKLPTACFFIPLALHLEGRIRLLRDGKEAKRLGKTQTIASWK